MHIVFPLMGLPRSGGIRVVVELANGLVHRGHKVSILVARSSQSSSFALDRRVNVQQCQNHTGTLQALWWLVRNVPREADAIVGNYYLTAYPAAIVAALYQVKGYYLIQGYEPGFFRADSHRRGALLQRTLAKTSLHLPLRHITVSSWLQRTLRAGAGKESVVIHDGVDINQFSPCFSVKERNNPQIIFAIGRQDPNKGLSDLLEAVRILSMQSFNVRVLIASQDQGLIVDSSVPCEIVHPANDQEMAMYYRQADVFVFPSRLEGFGLPPLEAMACGTPVVTTDCGGVRDFAEDNVNCLIVPTQATRLLAEAIGRILVDTDLAKQLALNGRETATRFTWNAMVDKFEAFLADPAHQ